ncbi:hypothetical protein Aperf_G00000113899 [Anoplocephala perfoliata]
MSDALLLRSGSNFVSKKIRLFQKPPTGRIVNNDFKKGREEPVKQQMVQCQNGTCELGRQEDSGFHSNFIEESHSRQDLDNPGMKLMEREEAKESHLTDSVGAPEAPPSPIGSSLQPALPLPPFGPFTSTPTAQTRRRSSFTLGEPTNKASPTPSSIRRAPSFQITTTEAQNDGMKPRANHPDVVRVYAGQLVVHTVAERRARAEALAAERQRTRLAKLAASQAALEAAHQRVQSLRAARTAELRVKQEERRAKVAERRKMLEKHREELLTRRVLRSAHSPCNKRLHREAPVSICGFSSELDPSDPCYCPFGFGSSSRRDVCLSTKQQLIALKTLPMTRISASFTADSQSRSHTLAHTGDTLVDQNINSTAPQLFSRKDKKTASPKFGIPEVRKASNQISKTPSSVKAPQRATDNLPDKCRSVVTPSPIPRRRPLSIRSVKNSPKLLGQGSIRRKYESVKATQAKSSPITVSASYKLSESEAQTCRDLINEQRKIVQERKSLEEKEAARLRREEEMNNQLEAIARVTVDEAICLAVAELKAEAVEASATSVSGKETVASRAAQLLSEFSNNNGDDLEGASLEGKVDSAERFLESALTTSKKALSNAMEKMTLTANSDCIRKSQSEIITVLANATSDVLGRERRRARLDEIMSRVRTSSTDASSNPGALTTPLAITLNCVNGVVGDDKKRYHLRPCRAIKSMLENGTLPKNCKAAVLLKNRAAHYEQMPPLELCSPCTETSSISEFEPRLDAQMADSANSAAKCGNEQGSGENLECNTSSTAATAAVCFPLIRRIQTDELAFSHHSSCSDVSTNSGFKN